MPYGRSSRDDYSQRDKQSMLVQDHSRPLLSDVKESEIAGYDN